MHFTYLEGIKRGKEEMANRYAEHIDAVFILRGSRKSRMHRCQHDSSSHYLQSPQKREPN